MDGRPNCRNKAVFSNSFCLKRVFEKLRFFFLDGLVWTVGLTAEIKLRFQILRFEERFRKAPFSS